MDLLGDVTLRGRRVPFGHEDLVDRRDEGYELESGPKALVR